MASGVNAACQISFRLTLVLVLRRLDAEVVVAAHSTFSLMSVVLGHGMVDHGRPAEFYSPKWSGAIAGGLFTHLDQSGVRDVRELWA